MLKIVLKRISCLLFVVVCFTAFGAAGKKDYYQLKVYQLKNDEQVQRVDSFLREAYLPALHRAGIQKVGVFKPVANDTSAVKLVYVFIPYKSVDEWLKLESVLDKDAEYKTAGKNYFEAAYNNTPYTRMESILLEAFPEMMQFALPNISTQKAERVYELRSYEGPTEKYYENKVEMFNKGGEVTLFKRLGFNAVFYAKVLSGSHMPNLMYMTTFENMAARDAHWKTFTEDAQWKELSARPNYQNNVSHADIILMHPADYSDI